MSGHGEHQIWAAETVTNCPKCDTKDIRSGPDPEILGCPACNIAWRKGTELFVCTCGGFLGDNDQAIMHARENGVCETCLGTGEATPMGGPHGTCTSCAGSGVGYYGIEETVTLQVVLKVRRSDIRPNSDTNQPAEFIRNEFATRARRILSGQYPPGDPWDGVVVGTIGPAGRSLTIYTGRVADVKVMTNEIKAEDAAK
ncbi:hypothetical protein [Nonomuraea sp. SYSU D8015]|uniref:hypothetical protein n=1 Tax=Nonomuraea sp. SYSU D8015 TaxID=2593644 RepID=UPI0016608437|nr:hypothetical protein [Nonomuraea sp. SYSU D8015]